jgi:DNA polymerase
MSDHLRAWKEALEDLGVMGLIPEPLPVALAAAGQVETIQAGAIPVATIQGAAMAAAPAPRKAAPPAAPKPLMSAPKPKEAHAWAAPTDPIKNPPAQSIENCDSLEALNACICRCEACPLGTGRIKFVFGEGSQTAKMMFIGEGPGRDEDIQGRPFVGRAGALLDKMIGAINMDRSSVYIANIVKCRPPDNRTPTPMESQTCIRYLIKQIELIKPAVLVGLGATPLREFAGISTGITKIRGSWHVLEVGGKKLPFMPTFHPAYVLRSYTKDVRQAVWDDLQAAQKKLEELGASPTEPEL